MEKLDAILKKHTADGEDTANKLLGAAFVVVNSNGIIYEGASGRIDMPPASPAFSPDSFTWVASMTKIVTASCMMQLVERGLVNLDDDVRSKLPEMAEMRVLRGFDEAGRPMLEDNIKPITLRHLLTHTVGLGYDLADPDLTRWSNHTGRKTNNLTFTYEGWWTPLKFVPGEGWLYGTALDWAGLLLERVTGQGLGSYMAEHFFRPLGMPDTTFHSTNLVEQTEGRVVASSIRKKTGLLARALLPPPLEPPAESGGAGLWTTARDYSQILREILAAGKGQSKLLKKATVDDMFRPQLNHVQRQMLEKRTRESHDGMIPEFEQDTTVDHGIGGIINTRDVPGKRKKGSMMWQGMANSHWWIDQESGIAAALVVHVLPLPDPVVVKLYDELERAAYEHLLPTLEKEKL